MNLNLFSAFTKEGLLKTIGVFLVFCYVFPWVLAGKTGGIRVHDGLDSMLSLYVIMKNHGLWFANNLDSVGPIFADGLPRVSYLNELNLNALLFSFLDPFWAYVSLQFITRLIGFFGMWSLLNTTISSQEPGRLWIIFGVSVCFAYQPFWIWTAGAAALPFMLFVGIQLWRDRMRLPEYTVVLAYPFLSSMVFTGFYIVALFWLLIPIALIFRNFSLRYVYVAFLITVVQVLVDYRLFSFSLSEQFVSHRVDFVFWANPFATSLQSGIDHFFDGNSNAPSLHKVLILPLAFFSMVLYGILSSPFGSWCAKLNFLHSSSLQYYQTRTTFWCLFGFVFVCLLASLFIGLWSWTGMKIIASTIPILAEFNPTRIYFANSLAWMLVFALSLLLITLIIGKNAKLVIALIIVFQIVIEVKQHEFRRSKLSYQAFFAQKQFEDIARAIPENKADYLVGSIGIHPSIAQFNGFRTADGYITLYPKSYKDRFRRVVVREFERRADLLTYFDDWGNRVYFFSSELMCPRNGSRCVKGKPISVNRLEYDMVAMKELGVRYLISVPEIGNAEELNLTKIKRFEHSTSAWSLALYRIN